MNVRRGRPATDTLREFVLELAAERLPVDKAGAEPGELTAILENLEERELWRLYRRLEHFIQKARRLVGHTPAGNGEPDFTRL